MSRSDLQKAIDKMESFMPEAIDVLEEIARDTDTDVKTRIRAVNAMLQCRNIVKNRIKKTGD